MMEAIALIVLAILSGFGVWCAVRADRRDQDAHKREFDAYLRSLGKRDCDE